MSLFMVIPIAIFLCLLWGPTLFVILRQKSSRQSHIRTIALSFTLELIVVAGLAFISEWAGLLNPAGYLLLITLTTCIVGAISVYFLLQAPITLHSKGTPNGTLIQTLGSTMLTQPSKLEFIESLRAVPERLPNNKEEMKVLENECRLLMKQIVDFGFANTCPDDVWHYLTDVDIRFKDPEYTKYQLPLFIAALDEWSSQALPDPSFKRDA